MIQPRYPKIVFIEDPNMRLDRGEKTYFRRVIKKAVGGIYREGYLVADLGWVDNDVDCSTILPCCLILICPSRI